MSDQLADGTHEPQDGRGATALANIKVPTAAELKAAGKEEFEELKDDVILLIRKRVKQALANPGRQGRIEDTHLFSLATNILKIDATRRRDQSEGEQRQAQVVNYIEIVKGLPPERASELMVAAIRQLEAAGQDATDQRKALATIVGAEETERLLAIEATTREEP